MNNVIKIQNGKIYIDDVEIDNVSDVSIYDQDDGIRVGITFLSKGGDNDGIN